MEKVKLGLIMLVIDNVDAGTETQFEIYWEGKRWDTDLGSSSVFVPWW